MSFVSKPSAPRLVGTRYAIAGSTESIVEPPAPVAEQPKPEPEKTKR